VADETNPLAPPSAASIEPDDAESCALRTDAICHEGEWYVSASSAFASTRKLVLKDNESFVVADRRGDFPGSVPGEFGYYHRGTRYLSVLEARLQGDLPLVLDSSSTHDHTRLVIEMTNGAIWGESGEKLAPHLLYLRREIVFEEDVLFERLSIHNFAASRDSILIELTLSAAADFADIFEVRGTLRKARGRMLVPRVTREAMLLAYHGLDDCVRTSEISVDPPATFTVDHRFVYRLRLGPGEDYEISLRVKPESHAASAGEQAARRPVSFPSLPARLARSRSIPTPQFRTDHDGLNHILENAVRDIATMLSATRDGPYPYAGVPWYCAPFGRDGSITAMQLLPWMPEVARGVLLFQARHQARDFDDFTDREPGKIFHELRVGEMAALREIPFIPYYGSLDSTPLYLILLREYVRTTDDRDLLQRLWPNALAAIEWMERYGDLDGDGFVEYSARSSLGLRNQGWKDSLDSISHEDGSLAEPPIAPCEVQGYVYAAFLGASELAELIGDGGRAPAWRERAEHLRRRIHERYWLDERGYFALALDRDKRPCRVLTTNAGHLLWSGAADDVCARRLAERLSGRELSSGFGLRTLETGAARFNPLSYHNGSIWPHDNAIVAEGLRRYGHLHGFLSIFTGILNAVEAMGVGHVPELFCGFSRASHDKPVPFPVACIPQAWASGAVLQLIRGLLGVSVRAADALVCFDDPVLPEWLKWIEVRGLCVPGGSMEFIAVRGRQSCSIEVLAKPDNVRVVIKR
jgi:glycogen debranching enzyme